MQSDLLTGGAMNLNRLTSDASWQRMMQRAEQAKAKVEASTGRAHKMDEDEREELRETCQKFESIFLGYLLRQMRKTVQKSSFMPETPARKMYMSMFDDEVARSACKGGGTGLSDMIFQSLINSMEEQSDNGETESANRTGKESAKDTGLTFR